MKLIAAGRTNVGMKRSHNEDNHALAPDENFYVVADGMGGHACGEVASQMAVDAMVEFFRLTSKDEEQTWPFKEERNLKYEENRLVASIKLANRRIYESAQQNPSQHGMGTTIVGALFTNNGAYIGHCGDSRAYRFRDGKIEQLTSDHSLLNDYLKAHTLTQEEIDNFPHKNVIVRALGMKEFVKVDVSRLQPKPNDLYMLCSDGLSGMVPDEEMNILVQEFLQDPARTNDVEAICDALIDRANKNGGNDNVTTTCIKLVADG